MDSMDLISVVVPIYNVKDYLKRCVDSIRKQSYNNIEIILVDDGSNDGSEKIVDRFAEQDYRIQVVHQKNQGLSGARNSGLKVASGKYIAFIDSDDFISELFIERLYYACVKNDADMAICDYLQGDFKFIPVEHNPGLVCCFDSSEMLGQWHSKYTKVVT